MRFFRAVVCVLAAALMALPAEATMTKAEVLAKFPQPETPPVLSFSLPDAVGGRIVRGKKIVLRATLSHPGDASAKPIELVVPEKKDWRSLVGFEVRGEDHLARPWKWTMDPAAAASKVVITPDKPAQIDYTLDEAASAQIAPGDYLVDSMLMTGMVGETIRSELVRFSVTDAAAPAPNVLAATAPAPPSPAVSTKLPAAPPKVSVYVNDAKNLEHLKGWPMIVRVGVEAASDEPFALAVGEGDWSKLINVEVRDADGVLQEWTFERASLAQPVSQIQINKKNSGMATLLVSGQTTASGKPGRYTLRAVLAMGASGKLVRSEPVSIQINEHPESLSDEMSARREKLMAVYHALRGEREQAIRSVENARAIPIAGPQQPPMPAQTDGRYVANGYSAPANSPQAGLMDMLSQFGAGGMIGNLQDGMITPSGEGLPDLGSIVGGGDSDTDSGDAATPDPPDENPPVPPPGNPPLPAPPGDAGNSGDSGNSGINHTAPNGFDGPDMTLRVEWSGDPVEMHVENGEDAVGLPMTQTGPNFEQLRPWDLRDVKDPVFYAAVFVPPHSGGYAKATAKVSYQRSPTEPVQTETVELDEAKNHDSWVAFKIDCASGSIEWIKRFHSSITSYLDGDPEETASEPDKSEDGQEAPSEETGE